MRGAIVDKQDNFPTFCCELAVEFLEEILKFPGSHPGVAVVSVVHKKIRIEILAKTAWTCGFCNNQGLQFVCPCGIRAKSDCDAVFLLLPP